MSYLKAQATADKLLRKFGQSVVITHKTAGAYDPNTGITSVTDSTQTGIGAIFDWGTDGRFGLGIVFREGTDIVMGDKQLLLSVVGITPPSLGDQVTIGTKVYTIQGSLKIIAPAGIPVLIEANLRGI
jgi:hypothetical protein